MKAHRNKTANTKSRSASASASASSDLHSLRSQQRQRKPTNRVVSPPTTIELRGVPIHFPFQPYKCQKDYMEKVLDALNRSENALLESPTGTGKTLCLLCSALAWQREQAKALNIKANGDFGASSSATAAAAAALQQQEPIQHRSRRVPTIIYASRTHSQLSQVVRELRNTRYRPKHAVLGSREQYCVNPKVKKADGTSAASTINHDCSVLNKDRRCRFKNKVEGFKAPSNESSQGAWFGTQPVMDMEDLVSMGKSHQVCPFYYTRSLVEDADLVLVPYNYLFDKDARTTTLSDIPWDNAVIIFDEAHNLESFASDSASFDISSKDIAGCMSEIDKALNLVESYPDRFEDANAQNLVRLKAVFLNFEEHILKGLPQQATSYQGDRILEIFEQGAQINFDNHQLVLKEIKKILDMFMEIRGGNSNGAPKLELFVQCIKRVFGEPSESRCQAKTQSYRVHLSQSQKTAPGPTSSSSSSSSSFKGGGNGGRTLSYWCFAPSEAMRELANLNVRSIIVTSGTLSPLESYALELDLPFPNRLENPHIISEDQMHVRVIGQGVSNKLLTSSYERRQSNEYYVELGNTLASLSRVIPCGMLVFFPSYGVMETSIERWGGPAPSRSFNKTNGTASNFFAARQRKSGSATARYSFPQIATESTSKQTNSTPWKRLLSHKAIVIEPRSSSDLPDAIAEFHRFLNLPKSKGVALFGVCRGKISEGIDFADEMCRAVIITGLPFAPSFDPKVKMKREFLDQNKAKQNAKASTNGGFKGNERKENSSLSGHEWYTQQAHRAVNQAIGRVIRNKRDYGAVLLMDSRFGLPGNQNGLSKWVRPHILPDEGFGQATQKLAQFYIKAKEKEEKEEEELMPAQSPPKKPTNVSMILKYENEGKENTQLDSLANEDDITKIAFIRTSTDEKETGVETKGDDFIDKSYIDPHRVIARVDMTNAAMMQVDKEELPQKEENNSHSRSQPQSVQKPLIPSSVSHGHKPNVIQTKSPGSSPAAQFFHRVKSTMTRDEFDSIKKAVVLMKKYTQQKHRKEFMGAARGIIQIILNHETFDNRSTKQKPKLIVSLLQLLPKHFVKDGEQLTIDLIFRKSPIRNELRSAVPSEEYMKLHMECVILLTEVWFEENVFKKFLEKLEKLLGRIVKNYKVTKSALTQFVNIVPSELQRVTIALIDEMKASIKVSKIKACEKARMGEESVKSEHFRKSYLNNKNGENLAKDEDKDGNYSNVKPSALEKKPEDHRDGLKVKRTPTDSDSRSSHRQNVSKKIKITKNPYAKTKPNTQIPVVKAKGHATSIQGRNSLSALLEKKKRDVERCNQDGESPVGSSLESIVRHSGSDINTYAGGVEKIRQTIFSSNAPKNINCTICALRLEKLYISECGHMACLQCVSELYLLILSKRMYNTKHRLSFFYVDFVIIAKLIAMLTVSIYLMFCTSFVCLVEKMISGNNGLVEAILVHSVESQHL
jgi:regulator of telomere elongation helicase 1